MVLQNFFRIKRLIAYKRYRVGKKGEDLACRFLKSQGYFIWQRNWRCRRGELDIIAYCDRTLRIIEVKTRKKEHEQNYPAITAIDSGKSYRLNRLAAYFVSHNSKQIRIRGLNSVRIEAITVLLPENWLKSAEIIYYQYDSIEKIFIS